MLMNDQLDSTVTGQECAICGIKRDRVTVNGLEYERTMHNGRAIYRVFRSTGPACLNPFTHRAVIRQIERAIAYKVG